MRFTRLAGKTNSFAMKSVALAAALILLCAVLGSPSRALKIN